MDRQIVWGIRTALADWRGSSCFQSHGHAAMTAQNFTPRINARHAMARMAAPTRPRASAEGAQFSFGRCAGQSEADLAAVITNGKNKMPAFGKQLKPAKSRLWLRIRASWEKNKHFSDGSDLAGTKLSFVCADWRHHHRDRDGGDTSFSDHDARRKNARIRRLLHPADFGRHSGRI